MRVIDLTNQEFGRLTVLYRYGSRPQPSGKGTDAVWWTKCICGTEGPVLGTLLRYGKTQSCGCLRREMVAAKNTTHGKADTRTYSIWCAMKTRCANPNNIAFENYGGRGISVCERWEQSYEAFEADMGIVPDQHSIEREDNKKGYEPGNCVWATSTEQGQNKRNSRRYLYGGLNLTASEWYEQTGIPAKIIADRIRKNGWSVEQSLTVPNDSYANRPTKNGRASRKGERAARRLAGNPMSS